MVDGSVGTDRDPVDLERLRSVSSSSGVLADLELAESVVAAVLAAPTVWWCEDRKHAMAARDPLCAIAEMDGCGLVALVPVKGES